VLVSSRRSAGLIVVWCLLACSESASDAEVDAEGTGEPDEATTGSLDASPADQCVAAPRVAAGRHPGSLRGNTSDRGGACGLGGPDAFVVLETPRRVDVRVAARGVGFSPVVGVRSSRCEHSWSTQLSCTRDLEGWVLDVSAGSRLLVSVGISPDDPALSSSRPPGQADPLDFLLELELRNVLLEGEQCTPPSRGRCVTGTVCMTGELEGESSASPRCVAIEGDTCASAIPVSLELGTTVITLDRTMVQTDAHAHSCGGARRPERVLRLALPALLESGAILEARTSAPDVLLALRGPGCAADEELGCGVDTKDGTAVTVDGLAGLGMPDLFLFVELPRPAHDEDDASIGGETGELAPLAIEVELSGG
jgi:hypothetical protein